MRTIHGSTLKATALVAGAAVAASAGVAAAASAPLSAPRIAAHFKLSSGQQPENIVAAPDGAVDVTFAAARQVARVSATGKVKVLATLPAPPKRAKTPALGFPLTTGLQRSASGSLYVLYATGDGATTGLWRVRPGEQAVRIAALDPGGLPNGLAYDGASKSLYVADSVKGVVYRVAAGSGLVTRWATGAKLASTGFLGVNGVRIHNGALYASNLDKGTMLRIPIGARGRAGAITTVAHGLKGIDDFAFVGKSGRIIAALNPASAVVQIGADGSHHDVLTRQDGLSNPTAVLIRQSTVLVTSAAYLTKEDPNLLTARLAR